MAGNYVKIQGLRCRINKCMLPIDGPRDCHTEWSKSDREEEILNAISFM